jgi:cytochrome b6-f complex subunit 4
MTEPAATLEEPEKTVPFFPVQFMREARMAAAITVILFVMAALRPIFAVEMGPAADPMVTPQHIKPEWYFLAVYQILKYVPKTAGAMLPLAVVGVLFVLPFINRRPDADARAYRLRAAIVTVLAIVFLVLTVLGRR